MNAITINDRIRYIEAADDPLSADIGIIRQDDSTWLYDVGDGEKNIAGLDGCYHIVLSHFHADHTGNIDRLRSESLYLSKETYDHVHRGTEEAQVHPGQDNVLAAHVGIDDGRDTADDHHEDH